MGSGLHRRPARGLRWVLCGLVLAGSFLLSAAGVAAAYFSITTVVPGTGATARAATLVRPTGASATEVPDQPSGAVTISWTPPPAQAAGASYDVDEGSSATPVPGCTGRTVPSCSVSGLTPGAAYTFSVRAVLQTWRSPSAGASVTTFGVKTTSLPAGTVHIAYAATLRSTGGTSPSSWTLAAGTLPSWATLHPTGAITGTPTAPGTTSGLRFTARDANGVTDVSVPLTITVNAALSALTVRSLPDPSVTGEPVVFTAAVLHRSGAHPTGTVTFDVTGRTGTRVSCLKGTVQPLVLFDQAFCAPVQPLVASDSPYAVAASYSGSTTVAPSTGALSPPQTVDPDATATTLSPAAWGSPDGVPSGPQPTGAAASYIATVTADLPGSGTPSGTVRFTATGTGGSTTLCADVALQAGKATCAGGRTAPGASVVTASYEPATQDYLASSASLHQQTLTPGQQGAQPAGEAPSLTSPPGATFTAGTTQSMDIVAAGSPAPVITESGALPPGISFAAGVDGTATMAGAPELGTAGTYPVTLTAENGVGPGAVQTFTLTIVTRLAGLGFADVDGATFACTTSTRATVACTASAPAPGTHGPVSARIELLSATSTPLVNTSGTPIALRVTATPTALPTATAGPTETAGRTGTALPTATAGPTATTTEATMTPAASQGVTPVIEPGSSTSNDAVSVTLSGGTGEPLIVTAQFAGKTYTLSVGPKPVRATAVRRRRVHRHPSEPRASHLLSAHYGVAVVRPADLARPTR